jgi:dihydrofolate reductase
MTTGHVFIATSLDGFIARPDGGLDWLQQANATGEDYGYNAFVSCIDGLFMGRATFDVSLGFEAWPYEKPIIVLSSQLQDADIPAPLADQVSIARNVHDAREEAARTGWKRAYVDGGATIQSFFRVGAIQDMVITRIPVLLGSGLPLFGPLDADIRLKHLETRSFPSGLVQSHYDVV